MKKLLTLSIIFLIAMSITQAQDERKPALKLTSFSFNFGFAGVATANTTEDYNNLKKSVNDPSLFIDASDYQYSRYNYGFGGNVNPKVSIGLSIFNKARGEYRNDRELRFSVGSGSGMRRNFNYYHYKNFVNDTFESANTGNVTYSDSVIFNRYIYSENYFDVNFGVSFLFKTPVERRFHFSAGAGIEYGIAIRSFVKVENYNDQFVYFYDNSNKPVFDEPDYEYNTFKYEDDLDGVVYTFENTNMKGNMQFFRTYLPLGINFRVSNNTNSFFNKVYLFGEMSPGIELQMVSNDKTYVNPYFGFVMLGFSYRW